jgi:mannose-6-phosphate isomerase-like protein (cupin superfamily)
MEQWSDPGHGAPTHCHPGVEEVIVILAGCATIVLDGHGETLETGDVVVIPPGTPHSFRNDGDVPLQTLAVFASGAPPVEYLEGEGGAFTIGSEGASGHRTPSGRR